MSTPPPLGMSTPPPPPPPPPSSSRKGCFIALGAVFVLLIVGCLVGCLLVSRNPTRFMAWGAEKMRPALQQSMASDVTPEQRAAFDEEYEAYIAWLRQTTPETMKTLGPAVMQPFEHIQGAIKDQSLTSDEMERFIEMSRQVRGASAPPVQEPAAEPATAPEGAAPEGASAPEGGTPVEGTAPDGASAPVPVTP